jgi:hypothetical protein
MKEKDLHREFNDCKELLGETKFTGEPDRKPKRRKSQLDRIESLLKKIFALLSRPNEATSLNPTVGPFVPEGDPLPEPHQLSKGKVLMNIVAQAIAGMKARVTLNPLDKDGGPATVDTSDRNTIVASTDEAKMTVSDIAADGLSFTVHALAAGSAQISIDPDVDLDTGEQRSLVDTIDFTIVAVGKPEAATLNIAIGTFVPEADPLP